MVKINFSPWKAHLLINSKSSAAHLKKTQKLIFITVVSGGQWSPLAA